METFAPTLAQICDAVAHHFGIRAERLLGRERRCVQARDMAIWLASRLSGEDMAAISRAFGRHDARVVRDALRRIEGEFAEDLFLRGEAERLLQIFGPPVVA